MADDERPQQQPSPQPDPDARPKPDYIDVHKGTDIREGNNGPRPSDRPGDKERGR